LRRWWCDAGASKAEFNFRAHRSQKLARGLDVADLRDVLEDYRFIGEQRGRHAGKSGVFCAADADGASRGSPPRITSLSINVEFLENVA